jgi:single-strand DNA-binding protein
MAKDLNKVMIIGNLTRDPELRYTPNGQAVASVGVATNRSWNDQAGERKEDVEFHDVVAWGKLAEICSQILAKGRRVYFEGRLQTRQWEGQDGAKRNKTEIVATDMIVLDKPAGGFDSGASTEPVAETPAVETAEADSKKDTKKPTPPADDNEINIEDIPF